MSRRADEPASGQPDNKRARTDAPTPAPAAMNIADIRARLAANKAAVEARVAAGRAAPTPPPASTSSSSPATQSVSAGPAALPPKPQMDSGMADKIAAAKKRIEAMTARSSNPYLSGSGSMPKPEAPKPAAGAMSSIALHPLLMGGQQGQEQQVEKNEKRAMRDRYKPMAPKFSSVKANVGAAPTSSGGQAPVSSAVINPYASSSSANPAADEPIAPSRRSRKMHFAPQGKYVEQGDQLRKDAKMEELKQRIAAASKKAGLDSEFDTLERSLKVSDLETILYSPGQSNLHQRNPPPDVEWWDKPLLNYGSTYDDISKAVQWITANPTESMVTHLVQHPIPIPAPGDKKQDERGLMLTKKEQKKMRRQRRKAELEDKRDRQKMGLLPLDAPKGMSRVYTVKSAHNPVRLANLMKVLTSDAVQDPTKVEAKVRKEVTARANKHEDDNEARKLTVEQRQEKEYQKMLAKERQAVFAAVYK